MPFSDTLTYRLMKREPGELINFAYWIPETYDPNKKYPMLVFFHGAGEKGTTHLYLQDINHIRFFERILSDPELKENFILLAPQCPEGTRWVEAKFKYGICTLANVPQTPQQKEAADKIFEFIEKYSVDTDRIYVTGLSMGGYCTWDILQRYPDLFAAAIPICGGVDLSITNIYRNIPLWIVHALDDKTVWCQGSRKMFGLLCLMDAPDVHYTEYMHCGHGSWVPAYKDEEIFQWLITRNKKDQNR